MLGTNVVGNHDYHESDHDLNEIFDCEVVNGTRSVRVLVRNQWICLS